MPPGHTPGLMKNMAVPYSSLLWRTALPSIHRTPDEHGSAIDIVLRKRHVTSVHISYVCKTLGLVMSLFSIGREGTPVFFDNWANKVCIPFFLKLVCLKSASLS